MKTSEQFARAFADELRIAMYGDCDLFEQVKRIANILAEYDDVPSSENDNHLLALLPIKG
jgi:hypothetical protein